MTEDDETRLERDLRRVLGDPGYRLPDRLVPLERVHAGAARRRRRRQSANAVLATVAVVSIGIGVAHPWGTGSDHGSDIAASTSTTHSSSLTPPPSTSAPSVKPLTSSSPHSSQPSGGVLDNVAEVNSVTALGPDRWWVTARIETCNDCGSGLLSTPDGGKTFAVVSNGFASGPGRVTAIRYVDPTHATAMVSSTGDGGGPVADVLRQTSDGGKTWHDAAGSNAGFIALEAGGGKTTWALQLNADSKVHLWRQLSGGSWKDIATLPDSPTIGTDNVQLAVQVNRAIVVWRGVKGIYSASFDTKGNHATPTTVSACSQSLGLHSLSAGDGDLWLTCPQGTDDVVLTSTNGGTSWQQVPVKDAAGRHVVGAMTGNQAVISTADGLAVLSSDGTLKTSTLPSGVNATDWDYLGFTNAKDGFALTDTGRLLRSIDGGLTWDNVTYVG